MLLGLSRVCASKKRYIRKILGEAYSNECANPKTFFDSFMSRIRTVLFFVGMQWLGEVGAG